MIRTYFTGDAALLWLQAYGTTLKTYFQAVNLVEQQATSFTEAYMCQLVAIDMIQLNNWYSKPNVQGP